MNKTIAIIELYQHDEVLRHYCDMLCDTPYNINVFCSKSVYDCIPDYWELSQFEWMVMQEGERIPRFLEKNQVSFQSCDLLFITTALSDFKAFYALAEAYKTLLLIHNVHSFLAPKSYLDFQEPVFDRLRYLKSVKNQSLFYKKKMLETLAGIAFPTEVVLDYTKEHFDLPEHLKVMSLPFAYFQEKEKTLHQKTTITIPCTLSSELRDYDTVLKAFIEIRNNLKEPIRLVLLGKPKTDGEKIKDSFLDLNSEEIEIITFDNFIPSVEYENWLMSTDFMILPLKAFGRNHIYRERLGYSKISGGINDMIRFGIPALITASYPLENALMPMTDSFHGAENLSNKIIYWMEQKVYLEKKSLSRTFLEKYNKDQISKDFHGQLEFLF